MRYAAAYVLATLGGSTNPDTGSISKILSSVGMTCDQVEAQKVIEACKGKNLEQLITEGMKKLSSLPVGGAAAPAGGRAAAPAEAKKGAAKEEPKKEEKKKEDSDGEGDDMVCIFKSIKIRKSIHIHCHFRALVYSIRFHPKQSSNIISSKCTSPAFVLVTFVFNDMCVCVFCVNLLSEKKKERRKERKKI